MIWARYTRVTTVCIVALVVFCFLRSRRLYAQAGVERLQPQAARDVSSASEAAPQALGQKQQPAASSTARTQRDSNASNGFVFDGPKSRTDACGCDLTFDMRCDEDGLIQWVRAAYFHTIYDCILPRYGALAKARAAAVGYRRCVITFRGLTHILRVLLGDSAIKTIPEDDTCVTKVRYFIAGKSKGVREDRSWQVLEAIKTSKARGLMALQADALHALGGAPTRRHATLIDRPEKRRFTNASQQRLLGALSAATHLPVVSFTGEESVVDMLRVFTGSMGLAGFHGAGFVNTLFASQPLCVVELSTYKDLASNKTWRYEITYRIERINPHVVWYRHPIPLQQLLEANGKLPEFVSTKTPKRMDKWLQAGLSHILVSADDARVVRTRMKECIDTLGARV